MTMAPIGAITKSNTVEWLEYSELSRQNPDAAAPKTFIADLPTLLKRVRKVNSAGDRSNDNGIAVSSIELAWLCRFHRDVRNQLTHFAPMGWSLEVSGVKSLTLIIVRIIREIDEVGWAFRHREEVDKTRFVKTLTDLELMASPPSPIGPPATS
nr:hypothetical protein [Polymorphobacter sp.]